MQLLETALKATNALTICSATLAAHITHMLETEPKDKHDFSFTEYENAQANAKKIDSILNTLVPTIESISKCLEEYYNEYKT